MSISGTPGFDVFQGDRDGRLLGDIFRVGLNLNSWPPDYLRKAAVHEVVLEQRLEAHSPARPPRLTRAPIGTLCGSPDMLAQMTSCLEK